MADFESITQTAYGKVEGREVGEQYRYLGIPYAKPPVGALRFKRAEKPEAWENTIACKQFGADPIQFSTDKQLKFLNQSDTKQSEDCLTLNIWAPKKAEKAPVFVFIYGGSNHTGRTSDPRYSLEKFPADGVIGVSFNYRLGPLGFYDFSNLDSTFDSNCGVSDWLQALTWIKENIENFGGDPENITLCGESAGGTAVYTLLSTPKAQGLFQKAIAMSGQPGNVNGARTQELNQQIFFDTLGLVPNEVAKLQDLPVEKLIPAGSAVLAQHNQKNPGIFAPGVVLDDLVPKRPAEALVAGAAAKVKCIFGTCRDEGTLFYWLDMLPKSWKAVDQMLKNNQRIAIIPQLRNLYGVLPEKKAMEALGRDRYFWADTVNCTLAQSQHVTVWAYRYDFEVLNQKLTGLGAVHGSDVVPALGTSSLTKNPVSEKIPNPRQLKMEHDLHRAWVNFAKQGTPNGNLNPKWPAYDQKERITYLFDVKGELVNDPNHDFLEVWQGITFYE